HPPLRWCLDVSRAAAACDRASQLGRARSAMSGRLEIVIRGSTGHKLETRERGAPNQAGFFEDSACVWSQVNRWRDGRAWQSVVAAEASSRRGDLDRHYGVGFGLHDLAVERTRG